MWGAQEALRTSCDAGQRGAFHRTDEHECVLPLCPLSLSLSPLSLSFSFYLVSVPLSLSFVGTALASLSGVRHVIPTIMSTETCLAVRLRLAA